MCNKTKALKKHFIKRLSQRYGIKHTQRLHDILKYKIKSGKANLLEEQSLRVSIYSVWVQLQEKEVESVLTTNPVTIYCAYDKKRKTFITALPKDTYRKY